MSESVTRDPAQEAERPDFAASLLLQRFLGWLAFPLLGSLLVLAMRLVGRYTVDDLKKIRREFREIVQKHPSLLICPNHLTMIDSGVIQWAISSNSFYFFRYSKFPWNVPAIENFGHSRALRLITYLSKCIPIDRRGSAEHREEVLEKMAWLLRLGDPVMIFPEGRRSVSGRLDLEGAAYGPGLLVQKVPGTAVLCIYLRGAHQMKKSTLPAKGERFSLHMSLIEPGTEQKGMRGQRDLARQVLGELQSLEMAYFAGHPDDAPNTNA